MDQEATFDAILDHLEDGLVIHDQSLKVIRFNEAAPRILGVTNDQLMGKTPMDPQWKMIKEDGSPFSTDENPAVVTISTGKPVQAIMGLECGARSLRWISIRSTPCHIKGERHAIVTFSDITDQRLTSVQNALVLEASGVGIWRFNIQTQELNWDASMYHLYEVDRSEFSGHYDAWKRTVHPDDAAESERLLGESIANNSPLDMSFRILANGNIKHIRAKATILLDIQNQPHIMIGTNWDISDSKKTEEELKELSKLKDRFIATMSHEVRTPLNGIIGMAEIVAEENTNPDQRQHIDTLVQSANHLNNLITDILDFSKLNAEKIDLVEEPFQIKEIVESTVRLHSAKLKSGCSISVSTDIPEGDLLVGDPVRITQVLSNLLSNAIKFTNTGTVTITVNQTAMDDAQLLAISIEDTGIGIPGSKQDQLFEDFFQADSSRTRQYGGTGLGLAICKRLMDLMGGSISFSSKEGKGSTFTMSLRLQSQPSNDKGAPPEPVNPLPKAPTRFVGQGRTAQVIEDNPVNMKISKIMLEKMGFTVIASMDGEQGLDHYRQHNPSLILLDLHMPGIQGIDVLAEIRRSDVTTPVIVVTAENSEETKRTLFDLGASAFVLKPFNQRDLISVVKQVSEGLYQG